MTIMAKSSDLAVSEANSFKSLRNGDEQRVGRKRLVLANGFGQPPLSRCNVGWLVLRSLRFNSRLDRCIVCPRRDGNHQILAFFVVTFGDAKVDHFLAHPEFCGLPDRQEDRVLCILGSNSVKHRVGA